MRWSKWMAIVTKNFSILLILLKTEVINVKWRRTSEYVIVDRIILLLMLSK